MKILVLGLGYVGTANAVLLSQQNEVICYDLNVDRINLINDKKSPIEDREASEYLSQKNLNLKGVVKFPSQNDFDFVVIATPTNYDPDTNNFDTSTVESSIENLISQNFKATIIIRSTLPVGFIERIQKKYSNKEIILPVLNKISLAYQDYSGKRIKRGFELNKQYLTSQIKIYKEKSFESMKIAQEYALDKDLTGFDLIYSSNNRDFSMLPWLSIHSYS